MAKVPAENPPGEKPPAEHPIRLTGGCHSFAWGGPSRALRLLRSGVLLEVHDPTPLDSRGHGKATDAFDEGQTLATDLELARLLLPEAAQAIRRAHQAQPVRQPGCRLFDAARCHLSVRYADGRLDAVSWESPPLCVAASPDVINILNRLQAAAACAAPDAGERTCSRLHSRPPNR